MGGVSGDVSSLVIGVDDHVHTHALLEGLFLVAHHLSDVTGPIDVLVVGRSGTVLVGVVVDGGAHPY